MRTLVLVAAMLAGCGATVNAADPRFEACAGTPDNAEATIAFTARDYHDHFPLMGEAPELETNDAAFAVIFKLGHEPPIPLQPPLRLESMPAPSEVAPRHRTLCIYLGQPPDGTPLTYVDVDVALVVP